MPLNKNVQFEIVFIQTLAGYQVYRKEIGTSDDPIQMFKSLNRNPAISYFSEFTTRLENSKLYKMLTTKASYAHIYIEFECLPIDLTMF